VFDGFFSGRGSICFGDGGGVDCAMLSVWPVSLSGRQSSINAHEWGVGVFGFFLVLALALAGYFLSLFLPFFLLRLLAYRSVGFWVRKGRGYRSSVDWTVTLSLYIYPHAIACFFFLLSFSLAYR
jgi:hypothetical protein